MRAVLSLGLIVGLAASAHAQAAPAGAMTLYPVNKIEWKPGAATLPKGSMVAVLDGDPSKAGSFTMRIKFPANAKVMPHFHTATEHTTVISGTLHIGMGDKFDKAVLKPMPAGSFGHWPAGMHHFAWMEGETVLQMHGEGPWTITYVNPADDPRTVKP